MEEKWIEVHLIPGTWLFDQINKNFFKNEKFQYPCENVKFSLINKDRSAKTKQQVRDTYRVELEWQGTEVCGISVFKKVE